MRRKVRLIIESAIGVALLVAVIAVGLYLTGPSFQESMRARVVARLEQITGGKVELRAFSWNLARLELDLRGLTIHGLEGPGEVPYAHANHLFIRLKILSLLRRHIGLRQLTLDRATVHLIVYPDGSTNQPHPRTAGGKRAMQELFDLAANHVLVRESTLLVNDRPIPLDMDADDLRLEMAYSTSGRRYDGALSASRVEAKYGELKPLAAAVEAQFSVWSNGARLKTLKLSSGNSRLMAGGELRDFNEPRVELSYNAALDLAQLGDITHTPALRGGTLTLDGELTWKAPDFASHGKLAFRDLSYSAPGMRLSGVNLGADYGATRQKLRLPHVFATLLGGTATGEVEIADWIASPAGTARLRVTNLQLARVASAVSSRTFPLDRANLASTASGSVDATWKGTPAAAIAQLALDFTPRPNPSADELPVTGSLRGTYHAAGGAFEIAELTLATRATQFSAAGVLGTPSGVLKLTVNTSDLNEWKPALEAFGVSNRVPVELQGNASFNGTVSGKLVAPVVAGHLQLAGFNSLVAGRRLHWDQLTADVQYSSASFAAHHASLKRGRTVVDFDGSTQLSKGVFNENTPFALRAGVRNAELSEALAMAGYSYPATGGLSFDLRVSGTQANPQGSGAVVLTNAVIYGESVDRLTSDVVFARREAQFNNLRVSQNGSKVSGTAAYNLATAGFKFNLHGANINLGRISRLQTERVKINGSMSFTASGSGTTAAPAVNADLQLSNLVVNGERLGGVNAKAVTSGDVLRLEARSSFQNANIEADGTVRLRDDFPLDLSVRYSRLDIDPLLRMYVGRITGHSSIEGKLTARGPLRSPGQMTLAADINQLSMDIEGVQVRNDGPVRFTVAGGVARLERFRIVGTDTTLNATGEVQLTGARSMDLNANGLLNLKLLQTLNPDLVSRGQVALDVRIGGRTTRPFIDGQMEVRNASVAYLDLPNGLSDLNGRLTFNRDRLQVINLTGHTGGGTVEIAGYVVYSPTLSFNLSALGRDVRIRYPPGVSSQANANLKLTGSLQNALLAGDVTVTRFGVNPQFDFANYLARAQQITQPNLQSPLSRLRLDVHIMSTPEIQLQTSLAKLSGDVDLRLRGTAIQPSLIGRVNIIEGEISFNGTRYHLERGSVAFFNPTRIEPVLDIEASTAMRGYEITLRFTGPLGRLNTTYRSDPPLSTADIVNLIAFGRTREESAAQSTQFNVPEPVSSALLNEALNAAVGSRIQRLFGVSRIKIDPQPQGTVNNPSGATFSIEQQVAKPLTITYITNLSRTNYQTIQAEYAVNRNVSIVAVRDWNGVVTFDIKLRQRKR